jgi:glucose/arabinose dehydrogenase
MRRTPTPPRHHGRIVHLALAALALGACASGSGRTDELLLETVVEGLERPVDLCSPPGDSRVFVVEKVGRIRILERGKLRPTPFLDVHDQVSGGNEQGLLGLTFHPRFADNGLFFINYTNQDGDTRVVRYHVSADSNRADPASAVVILAVDQPYTNHNGGQLLFGPDGMLYVPLGDGGSGGDPKGNGQRLDTLLGKLLRIDVDHGEPYTVPRDNPFVRRAGARGEIWAYGLRNPWRICFDSTSDQVVIADVGQNQWEEVDVAPARRGGLNYGWNRYEGSHPFKHAGDRAGLVMPALEYPHSDGCSITGGVVYRGQRVPALMGRYVFGDYCTGWIESVKLAPGAVSERRRWRVTASLHINAFGVDHDGDLYVLDDHGKVLRVIGTR